MNKEDEPIDSEKASEELTTVEALHDKNKKNLDNMKGGGIAIKGFGKALTGK